MSDHSPLIVTATMVDRAFAGFEGLRQSHFLRHRKTSYFNLETLQPRPNAIPRLRLGQVRPCRLQDD